MNHSNFNFYDAFDFDDDTPVFAFQVAAAVVAEEESNNQGQRTGYRGSILGHNIVNRNRKEDLTDEYLQIGENTAIESLRAFVKEIIKVFGDWYLRAPNEADICRLLSIGEQRGFPGMLGSIDCMHWKWEKCPIAWHEMYTSHCREPIIILEAVASQDLWI
eukprot:XP_024454370.1 uncharacterized protein LOC112327137 [Populus trichocarpa]